ncbi:hypothetical protein [Bounagaea algeriensis]
MHCPRCDLRTRRTKPRKSEPPRIPRHYGLELKWRLFSTSYEQDLCAASGNPATGALRSNGSNNQMRCPACGETHGRKKRGRIKDHQHNGKRCDGAEANLG